MVGDPMQNIENGGLRQAEEWIYIFLSNKL